MTMIQKHVRIVAATLLAAWGLLLTGAPGCMVETADSIEGGEEETGEAALAQVGCPPGVKEGCSSDAGCPAGLICKYANTPCKGVCLAPAAIVRPGGPPEYIGH